MTSTSAIFSLLLGAALAGESGPTLWQNIRAGMSAEEVRSLYPAVKGLRHHRPNRTVLEDVQRVDRCSTEVVINHPRGVVTSVEISTEKQATAWKPTCQEQARQALIAKYGPPTIPSELPDESSYDRTERWVNDGISIRFEYHPSGIGWTLTYEAVRDEGL